ncbi:MAG: hypothetical protein HY959_03290 [Ignavibacteriae bacterium]|nr:hypothetical protein [Ignavibacteriota bacterium]
MNREFSKEELLFNLPDFIVGRLIDSEIKEAILNEIENNSGFRQEYEMLGSTIREFRNLEFSEPPANYFNNLMPVINEKIDSKTEKLSLSKSISFLWKIAVPAAAVLLFVFTFRSYFIEKEYTVQIKSDTPLVSQNDFHVNQRQNESNTNSSIPEAEDESDEIYDYENILSLFSESTATKKSINNKSENSGIVMNIDFTDNTADEDFFFSDDDETNFEVIFENMNKDQQNELLDKLKKSKL